MSTIGPNPVLSSLNMGQTPPKDPDHWPPTMAFPAPFWIALAACLWLYLSDINASDAKDMAPSEDLKACQHSRAKYAKQMLSMLRTANLFGIVRRDAAFDAFLPELISDAASSAKEEVRRAARDLIQWLSEHAPYKHHLKPSVQQISDMSYRTLHEPNLMEATEMLYTLANLFERLTPQQRQEAGPEVLALCRHVVSQPKKDLIHRIQLRPVARLLLRLQQQPELAPALAADSAALEELAASSDPVTSAYASAARRVASGDAPSLPWWVDSTLGTIGMEALSAAALAAAVTPFLARFNARWYTNPAKRVAWMNYSTLRAVPAAGLVAIPFFYGLRAINIDLLPMYPPERTSHSIVPFSAAGLFGAYYLVKFASPYWLVPSMAALATSGASSYHAPLWFRTAAAATPIADDFLREVPVHHALGFEERLPPSPLESWYWAEYPPRDSPTYETRAEAFAGALRQAFATRR